MSAFSATILVLHGSPFLVGWQHLGTVVAGAAPAAAGPVTGDTELLGAAVGGQEVVVGATLARVHPVVAYEFLLENRCWFKGRFSAYYDSAEHLTGEGLDDGLPGRLTRRAGRRRLQRGP